MNHMKDRVLLIFLASAVFFQCIPAAQAQDARPYGDFRKAQAETRYGEKRPVTSIEEAKKKFHEYVADKDLRVEDITEKELFFEADIRDRKNKIVDKVILDKRTGRIRSIF
jgi:hypothetical protein